MEKPARGLRITAPETADAAENAAFADVQQNVQARILPKGAGRVFTGEPGGPGTAAPTFGRGERFAVSQAVAEALEARGLVEIEG